MKIRPTPNARGVLMQLGPDENQIPAQSVLTKSAFQLKKILVPLDFSDCSKKALEYAVAFAQQFGAELILLHVVEPYPAVPEMAPYDVEDIQDGRRELEALRKQIPGTLTSSVALRKGTPLVEIAAAAEDFGSDLIIISTHGHKGLARMFLGSTTEKIVRHAPCPVLIVRELERDFVPNSCGCSGPCK